MELTMACATNITIMPGLLDKGSQDKENTSGIYTICNTNLKHILCMHVVHRFESKLFTASITGFLF